MPWPVKSLGDVCNIVGGGTPSKSNDNFYMGDIPWATVRDMRNELLSRTELSITEEAINKSSTNLIPLGTIITATRVGLGKVCVLEQDTAINQDLKAIIPKTEELDNTFLYWWLKSIAHVIVAAGTGATVQGVKLTFVKALEIPLPPIPEQKRIVALLNTVFADLEQTRVKTEQNLKNARELFDSYLQQVFSQKGEGWPLTKLVDTVNIVDSLHKTPKYSDNGYPMVRVTDIKSGELDLSNTRKVDKETYLEFSKRYKANVGDIVFSRVGSYGRSVIVNTNEQFCLGQNTVFLAPRFNGYYFYYFLNSPIAKEQIDKMVSGSTQPTVSLKSIKSILIPIPTEAKQAEVVQQLKIFESKINRLEVIYRQKSNSIDELKKSILQKAFSGELTHD